MLHQSVVFNPGPEADLLPFDLIKQIFILKY